MEVCYLTKTYTSVPLVGNYYVKHIPFLSWTGQKYFAMNAIKEGLMSKEIVKDPAQAIVKNPVFFRGFVMIKVFISGPLSGDPEKNLAAAKEACKRLVIEGFAPFCPHLSWYVDPGSKLGYDKWINIDLEFLKDCHVMLRLPGESKGAEIEENYAHLWEKPIFYDIDSLVKYFKEQK